MAKKEGLLWQDRGAKIYPYWGIQSLPSHILFSFLIQSQYKISQTSRQGKYCIFGKLLSLSQFPILTTWNQTEMETPHPKID
jgi:hypothetical protein